MMETFLGASVSMEGRFACSLIKFALLSTVIAVVQWLSISGCNGQLCTATMIICGFHTGSITLDMIMKAFFCKRTNSMYSEH